MAVSYGPKLGLLINAATGDQHITFRKLLRALYALVLLMVEKPDANRKKRMPNF
jgi:hypothetical protein